MRIDCVHLRLCFLLILTSCAGSIEGAIGQKASATGSKSGGPSAAGSPTGPGGASGQPGPIDQAGLGSTALPPYACKDTQPGLPDPPLRRLTAAQYANTVRDMVAFALKDERLTAATMASLQPTLDAVPSDKRPQISKDDIHGTFRRLAQAIQQDWVEATYSVARAAGSLLTKPETLARLVPCAVTAAANAAACVDTFIKGFGERTLRSPLQQDQVAFYRAVYGETSRIDAAAFADLVAVFLTAPEFLYHMEHGQTPLVGRPDAYKLSAHELASRLSYQFWDSMPDDALWAAAGSGVLLTGDGFAREAARLLASPRAQPVLDSFYSEWLELEDLPLLDARNADKAFQAFAGSDLPKPSLRTSMVNDTLDFLRHFTWNKPGTFDDVLASDLSFAKTADLAKIYGLAAPWDGRAAPPVLPTGTRPGLLTRAAMLASEGVRTHPILRGARLRMKILCDDLPPPPDNADNVAATKRQQLAANASARQEAELLTESQAECAVCHKTLINPLGYALEGFDTLSRPRRQEVIISATGALLAQVPVDTSSVPRVNAGDATPIMGPQDLVRLVQASGKAHACLARHYVRFTLGRLEDVVKDSCTLSPVAKALQDKASLRDAFKAVVSAPAFQVHDFGMPL